MSEASVGTSAILIAALGGEGGGVLADWVVEAIRSAGYACQSTSIPGVAQRTGATTYYIEYCPVPMNELGDRRVVFALTPVPGRVDVMLASELIEAARAVQNGYVTPDRTTLIGSSHRTYATSEKIAMGDGRYGPERAMKVVHDLSRRAIIFDMEQATEKAGTAISAVLFGALAGSNALAIDRAHFENAIKASGRGVGASLKGFALGFDAAQGGFQPVADERSLRDQASSPSPLGELGQQPDVLSIPDDAQQNVRTVPVPDLDGFPVETRFVVRSGYLRCLDYQDEAYARSFLERARDIMTLDRELDGANQGWRLTIEGSRYLALRMTYEDVIRVADLKTRASRFEGVRSQTRAGTDEPVHITEFLKPGPEELCALLPPRLGEWLLASLRRRGIEHRFNVGIYVRSHTITGFLTMRLLARMRGLRLRSWRFKQEVTLTQRWFDAMLAAARIDYRFGVEVAECADLVKGYSGTYRRGVRNFDVVLSQIVEPAIAQGRPAATATAVVRKASLADPEGQALDKAVAEQRVVASQPIVEAPRTAA